MEYKIKKQKQNQVEQLKFQRAIFQKSTFIYYVIQIYIQILIKYLSIRIIRGEILFLRFLIYINKPAVSKNKYYYKLENTDSLQKYNLIDCYQTSYKIMFRKTHQKTIDLQNHYYNYYFQTQTYQQPPVRLIVRPSSAKPVQHNCQIITKSVHPSFNKDYGNSKNIYYMNIRDGLIDNRLNNVQKNRNRCEFGMFGVSGYQRQNYIHMNDERVRQRVQNRINVNGYEYNRNGSILQNKIKRSNSSPIIYQNKIPVKNFNADQRLYRNQTKKTQLTQFHFKNQFKQKTNSNQIVNLYTYQSQKPKKITNLNQVPLKQSIFIDDAYLNRFYNIKTIR